MLTSLRAPERPYMVCVEERTGMRYLDRAYELDAHVRLFEHLSGVALGPAESVELIRAHTQAYQP